MLNGLGETRCNSLQNHIFSCWELLIVWLVWIMPYCISYFVFLQSPRFQNICYYAPLFLELRVNDWRDIKLFVPQCHSQSLLPIREWVQTHKLNIYLACCNGGGGGLFHSGAVQMFNFQFIHGEHKYCEYGAAFPLRNKAIKWVQEILSIQSLQDSSTNLPPSCVCLLLQSSPGPSSSLHFT